MYDSCSSGLYQVPFNEVSFTLVKFYVLSHETFAFSSHLALCLPTLTAVYLTHLQHSSAGPSWLHHVSDVVSEAGMSWAISCFFTRGQSAGEMLMNSAEIEAPSHALCSTVQLPSDTFGPLHHVNSPTRHAPSPMTAILHIR